MDLAEPDRVAEPVTPAAADRPSDVDGLTTWVLRRAMEAEDGRVLLDELGLALNAARLPVLRLGISLPALNPVNQGVNLTWQRGRTTDLSLTAHGAAGDAEFQGTPLAALLNRKQDRASWLIEAGEGCGEFAQLAEMRDAGATEYLLRTVRFASDIAIQGVAIGYATDRPGGFSDADRAAIEAHLPALGLAIYRVCLSRTMRQVLGAYVGQTTADRVLNGSIRRGEGAVISAAILLADLKGFTALADREDPLDVVGWLDQHLEALGSGVRSNGGEILKFTGDGFVAVFPVEHREAVPCRVCAGALDAARTGLATNHALRSPRRTAGRPWLGADLVLHFGEVVYGNIGTADRLDFTAIGRAVNEASRIEALCDATGRNLLLSDSFAERCAGPLVDLGTFPLRGVADTRRLWTVDPV